MLYSVLSGVAAFLVCAVLLRIFIPILRRVKLGQKILEIGPSWHKSKEGTPIMGGLFFSIAITAAAVAFSLLSGSLPLRTLLVLGFALLCGLIGFVDDYVKLFKKTNRGLSPMQKLVLQFLVVAAFFVSLSLAGYASTELQIPFTDKSVDLGVFYYLVMSVVLVYFVNGANLTDGIDGLAGSVALVIMVFHAGLRRARPRFDVCRHGGDRRADGVSYLQFPSGQDFYGRHGQFVPRRSGLRADRAVPDGNSAVPHRLRLSDRGTFGDAAGRVFQKDRQAHLQNGAAAPSF